MEQQFANRAESFATYLAKQFIVKKGYQLVVVPEAQELVGACDILLTKADGLGFDMICIVDRDSHPDKRFQLDAHAMAAILIACNKYTGTVHNQKMPATIQIFEVGKGADDADARTRMAVYRRATEYAKCWIVDPLARSLWSNAAWGGTFAGKGFITRLLNSTRESEAQMQARATVIVGKPGFPYLTYAILGILIAVFGLELLYGVEPFTGLLQPSLKTIIALGGSNKVLVLEHGEWYRLCSAIFLHADGFHLLMNGIALVMVGYLLEGLVGRAWFAAIFVIGGLGGSFMSLAVNPANIISMGASGAIMALFAAALACSFRMPGGAGRTNTQIRLVQVLIPSLIPLVSMGSGHKVDFGAHFGGAITGGLLGYALLNIWSDSESQPGFRRAAAAIALAGFALFALAAVPIARNYHSYALATDLMPDELQPKSNADARAKSSDLVARYPNDPRAHMYRALQLIDGRDMAGAERELRIGLSKDEILKTQFQPVLTARLQVLLAVVVSDQGRKAEAAQIAAPLCTTDAAGDMRALLVQNQLCH
jgi:rhomboid protease GluP